MTSTHHTPNMLLSFRLQAGLIQSDVAEQLGLKSTDRISHWEKGVAMPSVGNLFKLARLYKVLPHELYPELFRECNKGNEKDVA